MGRIVNSLCCASDLAVPTQTITRDIPDLLMLDSTATHDKKKAVEGHRAPNLKRRLRSFTVDRLAASHGARPVEQRHARRGPCSSAESASHNPSVALCMVKRVTYTASLMRNAVHDRFSYSCFYVHAADGADMLSPGRRHNSQGFAAIVQVPCACATSFGEEVGERVESTPSVDKNCSDMASGEIPLSDRIPPDAILSSISDHGIPFVGIGGKLSKQKSSTE